MSKRTFGHILVVLNVVQVLSASALISCVALILGGTRGPLVAWGGLGAYCLLLFATGTWRAIHLHWSIEPDPKRSAFEVVPLRSNPQPPPGEPGRGWNSLPWQK